MAFITLNTGRIMNGSRMCTMAMYTPMRLKASCTGESTKPIAISAPLIRPSFCSSTIHAATRTSTDVQNGSSTTIISRLDLRVGRLTSQ